MGYELGKHLSRAGAEVIVLAEEETAAAEFDGQQEFPIRRIPAGSTDTVLERALQKARIIKVVQCVLRDTKPDCVLCMHWDPCGYILQSAMKLNCRSLPYFIVVAGMELVQLPSFWLSRFAKIVLRSLAFQGACKIFAISQFTSRRAIAMGLPRERIRVIPCGVEWDHAANLPASDRDGKSPRVLLTISRLVERKGHDTVLQALTRVIPQVPSIAYWIVGTGPESKRLERLVHTLGLEKYVEFHGQVDEKEKEHLLESCDLFVLPCRETSTDFEGFGIALVEAMKHAKPIIAGASGGVLDVVRNEETGLLVKPDDPESLAQAILCLLGDTNRARRLGENAWRSARESYRWDLIAKTYLKEMRCD